jgi:hypothetical protein
MPFGMKNAPATFQRMIHSLLYGPQGCKAYIDDAIFYSDTWEEHPNHAQVLRHSGKSELDSEPRKK